MEVGELKQNWKEFFYNPTRHQNMTPCPILPPEPMSLGQVGENIV